MSDETLQELHGALVSTVADVAGVTAWLASAEAALADLACETPPSAASLMEDLSLLTKVKQELEAQLPVVDRLIQACDRLALGE